MSKCGQIVDKKGCEAFAWVRSKFCMTPRPRHVMLESSLEAKSAVYVGPWKTCWVVTSYTSGICTETVARHDGHLSLILYTSTSKKANK